MYSRTHHLIWVESVLCPGVRRAVTKTEWVTFPPSRLCRPWLAHVLMPPCMLCLLTDPSMGVPTHLCSTDRGLHRKPVLTPSYTTLTRSPHSEKAHSGADRLCEKGGGKFCVFISSYSEVFLMHPCTSVVSMQHACLVGYRVSGDSVRYHSW